MRAEPAGVQAEFDDAYRRWTNSVAATSQVPQMFSASFASARPEFRRIKGLGINAAPYIVERIRHSTPDQARILLSVLIDVTKKRFPREEIDSARNRGFDLTRLYLSWWEHAGDDTSKKCAVLFHQMGIAEKDGNAEVKRSATQQIVDLGVLALPHLIEKVESGDASMMRVVSVLTDGAVREDGSATECLQWWTSNRLYWTLTPTPSHP